MAFIDTTRPNDAVGDVREMYARQQDKYGYVPNYAKAFSHRPELMARWAALQSGIRKHVDPRRFELLSFAAAHTLKNSPCSLAHGKLLTQHVPAEDVRAIAEDELATSQLPANEQAMVRFARKIARDASSITSGDVADLKRHGFTDAEVFDIVAVVAARAFFTKLLDGLGVEPDNLYQTMDERLCRLLTAGRPIDFRAPEQMQEVAYP
jgi:uncharacterized peroxidase-related enzyme